MTRFVALDTETTGLEPLKGHRVIELACVEFIDSKPTGRVFNTRLNPEGKKSEKKAFSKHKIPDSALLEAPNFKDVLASFIEFITDAHIVAFNADFDMDFMNSELHRAGHKFTMQSICSDITCAMALAKAKFELSRVSLDAACKRYRIDISNRTAHSAYI
ncbi:hypothetical protein A6F57_16510 [Alteromonas stellipolaris]|uniref:exonuclease domain-containing protein n=1 Tax=Alteromonas stellipolaris TaxID=233316 RepID=UPI0007B43783|nr:exonuclease domain-containing protein [Alteromonas stellipolaris]ANB26648.1 hypothetical protein A6F57_16510 [Alteromonas stellipolaris]